MHVLQGEAWGRAQEKTGQIHGIKVLREYQVGRLLAEEVPTLQYMEARRVLRRGIVCACPSINAFFPNCLLLAAVGDRVLTSMDLLLSMLTLTFLYLCCDSMPIFVITPMYSK